MAVYSSTRSSWTPTSVSDSVQFGANNYHAYLAAAAPAVARLIEVYEAGFAAASTVNEMVLRRDSTHATGATALTVGKFNPSSPTASGTFFSTVATTQPTPGTQRPLAVGFNSYGGVVRWMAGPGAELYLVGQTAPNDELSLSALSGTPGAMTSMLVVEEL